MTDADSGDPTGGAAVETPGDATGHPTGGAADGTPGETAGGAVAETPDGRGIARHWLLAVLLPVVVLGLLAAAYYGGVVGRPTAGVVDRGDWGTVTDERTEVVTTVWVHNPNPVGARFGDGLTVTYDIAVNGVLLAEGRTTGLDVPAGNTTMRLRTYLKNDRLDELWVAFLRADETLHVDFAATLRVDAGPTVTYAVERDRTTMTDSRPIRGALRGAAERLEGTYATTVGLDGPLAERLRTLGVDPSDEVTVGYEVRDARATIASVTADRTTVVYRLRVHNPGDVPVVASTEGVRLTVAANDVRLFASNATALSVRDVDPATVLRPGETRELTVPVAMNNDRVDEWFTRHVRRDERSTVAARFRLLVEHPASGETLRLPADGPVTYRCSFRTAILVDGRTAGTTCGNATGRTGSAASAATAPDPARHGSTARVVVAPAST